MYRIYFLLILTLIVSCENIEEQTDSKSSPISNVTQTKEADSSFNVTTEMVLVKGGSYVPLYGKKQETCD